MPVDDVAGARRAIAALQTTGPRVVLATSLALNDTPADALDMIAADGGEAWRLRTPRLPIGVNGAGDLIAALFFFHWLRRRSAADALAAAASSVYGIVAATAAAGARELRLVEAQDELVRPTQRFRAGGDLGVNRLSSPQRRRVLRSCAAADIFGRLDQRSGRGAARDTLASSQSRAALVRHSSWEPSRFARGGGGRRSDPHAAICRALRIRRRF